MHDARTGKLLWSHSPGVDISDGVVADIDPRHPGSEVWAGHGPLRTAQGKEIGKAPRHADWLLWWDGDLLRETYGNFAVFKWDHQKAGDDLLFAADPPNSREGRFRHSGMRPNLSADLLGDWREEVMRPSPDGKSLRIYTTTIPTSHRLVTLMHDPQYRLSVALQNVSYNKPPHPSYHLGVGMKANKLSETKTTELIPAAALIQAAPGR
jgi:rhamnogalacturonan endolyase